MASEVSHRSVYTGATLYFTIRSVSRQMWNTAGAAFEALTVANWTDYDVALTETPGSSYFYVGTFPAIAGNMVAGFYWVDVYKQLGAAVAIGDTLLACYWGYWDGTTFKWWADDTTHVSGTLQTAGDLYARIQNLPSAVKKNTALAHFVFPMYATGTRTPLSGVVVTCQRSIDGAAYANCNTVNATEIGVTGRYDDPLAAADLNGDVIAFKATAAGCDPTDILILTKP